MASLSLLQHNRGLPCGPLRCVHDHDPVSLEVDAHLVRRLVVLHRKTYYHVSDNDGYTFRLLGFRVWVTLNLVNPKP